MSATDDIMASKRWLARSASALDDACLDTNYNLREGKVVHLAFDPSFLFAPLALRNKLDITNPADWLDIAADVVFYNLEKYRPNIFGYQLVMPFPTFLTIQRNYQMDIELIEEIGQAKTDNDIFNLISARAPFTGRSSNWSMTAADVDQYLAAFLDKSSKKHYRLNKLRDYVRKKLIVTENEVLTDDIRRRAEVSIEEFEKLRILIDQYRTNQDRIVDEGERFIRGVEAVEIIGNKNISDLFNDGRYLFLAWPKSRNYYPQPQRYHRVITSVLFKLICLSETPSTDNLLRGAGAHLRDLRDQYKFALRSVNQSERLGEPLTPVTVRSITNLRDDYIKHLMGETKIMEDEERRKLAKGFQGTRRQVRDALSEAMQQSHEAKLTLAELAAEFRIDEETSGWETKPNAAIRNFLSNIKPQP